MNLTLRWLENVAFEVANTNGNQIIFDGPPEHGGKNCGMRPMEGMLSAAAACSAFDVVHILKKMQQEPLSLQINIEAERTDAVPNVFTCISLHFVLVGDHLKPASVARAVQLSVEKYCSALAMLNKTAAVNHTWRISKTP
ncbi:OsmC family protein [Candidatus Persebacteraceae bacterium Df01]|jgi:putative redox protein|uniref:OsmC family protein n=1 Tax=Candidatus Doriopsillibacter californiensis TaxID=2970740 RepID=A0ABT7QJQ0_9GAMM|nr:OsmC family protein [Candidatus Persebacteraceae bacterium Df01]